CRSSLHRRSLNVVQYTERRSAECDVVLNSSRSGGARRAAGAPRAAAVAEASGPRRPEPDIMYASRAGRGRRSTTGAEEVGRMHRAWPLLLANVLAVGQLAAAQAGLDVAAVDAFVAA